MPLESAKAIVIGSYVFNEQDKIVHLLTAGEGIRKIVAPGSSKGKNRFGSLLELFTEGEFFFYRKEDRELATLSKGDVVSSYFETVSDPERIFYFYLIAEILMKFVPQNFNTDRVYKLLKSILKSSEKKVEMTHLLLYFMIWILRIEGMMFESGKCGNCSGTDFPESWVMSDYRGIVCGRCRRDESIVLRKSGLEFIEWTKRNDTSGSFEGMSDEDRRNIFQVLKKKIEYHGEISLNSPRYLSALI
ncbi:MAG: DNA repair protein RecO [Acidobacteriota bacterium]